VKEFEELFLTTLEAKAPDALETLRSGKLADEAVDAVKSIAADLVAQFK